MNQNILFIVIDSCRSDKFFQNIKEEKTPNIDLLFNKGIYFSNAISSSDYTGPCIQSIFSSRYPFGCGTTKDNYDRIYSKSSSQLTILKEFGYHLYAILEESVCVWGMKEPFENNDVEFGAKTNLYNGLGEKILNKFEKKILKEPWFFYIHFMDLHKPYIVPSNLNHLKQSERYDYNLSTIDSWIGKILANVNLDNTLIIVTADHGDYISPVDDSVKEENSSKRKIKSLIKGLLPYTLKVKIHETKQDMIDKRNIAIYTYSHEKRAFKTRPMADKELFDDVVRVPLLFSGCGINSHKIIEQQVRSVDIFPTILDILNFPHKLKNIHGRSLFSFFEGKLLDKVPVYMESTTIKTKTKNPKAVVGIRTEEYKYFRSLENLHENRHLYDLKNDPLEDTNIFMQNPTQANLMEEMLQELTKLAQNQPKSEKLTKEEEKELEQELKKLGYI